MKTGTIKCLTAFLLLVLAACGTVQPAVQEPAGTSGPPAATVTTRATALEATDPQVAATATVPPPSPTPMPSPTVSPTAQVRPELQISQMRMFAEDTGWAVHTDSYRDDNERIHTEYKILRTTAGVGSWEDVSPPVSEDEFYLQAVDFVDANTAVAMFTRIPLTDTIDVEAVPWRTTDGGRTWQAGETIFSDRTVMIGIDEIDMVDAELGWMLTVAQGSMGSAAIHIFETHDGGLHWEVAYNTIGDMDNPDALWIGGSHYPFGQRFNFITDSIGFFAYHRGLFRSEDGGKSWIPMPLDPPADFPNIECPLGEMDCEYLSLSSIPQFSSPQDGVLIRRAYRATSDVWEAFRYHDSTPPLPLPFAQYLYYTHDGGQTWTPEAAPAAIGTAYFRTAQEGWFLGKGDPDPSVPAQLFRTVDGGGTWELVAPECPLPLGSEMQFVEGEVGYAISGWLPHYYYRNYDSRASNRMQVWVTRDGGVRWEEF